MLGSGAILVLDEDASIVELLQGILHFFAHESCGQCATCRSGTDRLVDILSRFCSDAGTEKDLDLLLRVSKLMQEASFCPLGQSPVIPIESALRAFKQEFLDYKPVLAHS